MTSPRKVAANRSNATKSTGPRTARGKARAGQNARRHGLSSSGRDPRDAAAVKDLMRQIAGEGADPDVLHPAQCIAEANIDLLRIRRVRQDLFKSYFPSAHVDVLRNDPSRGKDLPIKLAQFAKELILIDRYERRTLSRRKFAIRALDAVRDTATSG